MIVELLTEILQLINSQRADTISLRADLDQLKGEVMALKDQVNELVTKIESLKSTLATEVTELKAAFDALNARIDQLEGIDLSAQLAAVDSAIQGVAALSDLAIRPDTEIPSTPVLSPAANVTATSADLSWSASTDNVGVTGYEIFSGSDKVGDSTGTSFTASGLTPATNYVFSVRAKDAAGNFSAMSNSESVTTAA